MLDRFEQLAVAVPSRPSGDLSDDQLLVKARGSSRWDFVVVDVARIAPRMLRLTLSSRGLEMIRWQAGQDFTLLVAREGGRDIRRRYTIAAQDQDRISFDVYLHGNTGIGTAWAQSLRPGDTVSGIGPRGKLLLNENADWHLMIGDETSLPGIRAMLAATNRAVQVVVEVGDPEEWSRLQVDERPATRWTWLDRRSRRNGAEIENVALPSVGIGQAYVSGEADLVCVWRDALELGGLDASAIAHKAYWGIGRANATHGEPLG